MIFSNSRYATGKIFHSYKKSTDTFEVTAQRTFPTATSQFLIHVCGENDRIDQISLKFFGNSHLWWKIMDFNPEVSDPWNLLPGTVLRIPRGN